MVADRWSQVIEGSGRREISVVCGSIQQWFLGSVHDQAVKTLHPCGEWSSVRSVNCMFNVQWVIIYLLDLKPTVDRWSQNVIILSSNFYLLLYNNIIRVNNSLVLSSGKQTLFRGELGSLLSRISLSVTICLGHYPLCHTIYLWLAVWTT